MTSSVEMAANSAPLQWQAVNTSNLRDLGRARTEAINLVQWLVRLANSYVRDNTAERRTELEFHANDGAIVTRPFEKNLSVELRLPGLELQFRENGVPVPHIFDPEEHSPAQVEAWILVELLHRNVDRTRFSKLLPYSIPDLMTGDAQWHSPQSCRHGLMELTAWLRNAAMILDAAARAMGAGQTRIVCLPQTLALTCVSVEGRGSANVGFVPGRESDLEPFFYAGAGAANGRPIEMKRGILRASKLLADADPFGAALSFLRSAAG